MSMASLALIDPGQCQSLLRLIGDSVHSSFSLMIANYSIATSTVGPNGKRKDDKRS